MLNVQRTCSPKSFQTDRNLFTFFESDSGFLYAIKLPNSLNENFIEENFVKRIDHELSQINQEKEFESESFCFSQEFVDCLNNLDIFE